MWSKDPPRETRCLRGLYHRYMRARGVIAVLVTIGWLFVCAAARADNLFDIRGRPAEKGIVTVDYAVPEVPEPSSAMLRRLAGVLAELTPADIKALRACIESPSGRIEGVDEADLLCVIHVSLAKDMLTVEIRRTADGLLVARRGIVPGEAKQLEG